MGGVNNFINKAAGSGALGLGGFLLREQKLAAEKKGAKEQARLTSQVKTQLDAERKQKNIAEQSVMKQKEQARKRTIFAGSDIERSVFNRTLGSGFGTPTLG